jgi:spore coat protein U-like protein
MNKIKSMIAVAILIPSVAMAATDGPLSSSSSTGDMGLLVNVSSVIGIKHVNDINFGTFSPGINVGSTDVITVNEDICVYTNASEFEIEFSSANGTNDFSMTGFTSFESLPYQVSLTSVEGSGSGFNRTLIDNDVDESVAYGPFNYASQYVDESCGDASGIVDNISLSFNLLGSDIVKVSPDNYMDTVMITARVIEASFPSPL